MCYIIRGSRADRQRDLYLKSIVPIGILFSGSLILSNTAYLTYVAHHHRLFSLSSIYADKTRLSVSFIQMLKAFTPVAILLISALFKIQHLNQKLIMIVCVCAQRSRYRRQTRTDGTDDFGRMRDGCVRGTGL